MPPLVEHLLQRSTFFVLFFFLLPLSPYLPLLYFPGGATQQSVCSRCTFHRVLLEQCEQHRHIHTPLEGVSCSHVEKTFRPTSVLQALHAHLLKAFAPVLSTSCLFPLSVAWVSISGCLEAPRIGAPGVSPAPPVGDPLASSPSSVSLFFHSLQHLELYCRSTGSSVSIATAPQPVRSASTERTGLKTLRFLNELNH